MINVAIIDTKVIFPRKNKKKGIGVFHYTVKHSKVYKKHLTYFYNKYINGINHGRLCFEIFTQYASAEHYNVHCLEVLEEKSNRANIEQLEIALSWCLDNDIKLVCLSLGSRDFRDCEMLHKVITELHINNVIVVAAFNNSNTLTFPATFPSVIGVRCDLSNILSKGEYICVKDNLIGIDIISSCIFEEIEECLKVKIGKYNSYATPYIAAKVFNAIVAGNNTLNEIDNYLVQFGSKYDIELFSTDETVSTDLVNQMPIIGVDSSVLQKNPEYIEELVDSFQKKDFYAIGLVNKVNKSTFIFPICKLHNAIKEDTFAVIKNALNYVTPDLIILEIADNTEEWLINELIDICISYEINQETFMIKWKGKINIDSFSTSLIGILK